MSCWHGWHGCGPWYGPHYSPNWYGPPDWMDEPLPARRRRRYRRLEREEVAEELEARLAELHDEIRRVETELADLRDQGATAAEGP